MEWIDMNLQPKYFNFIKNGTKRIELRLFDEKRQKIKVGDIIEFSSIEDWTAMKVVALYRAATFKDLIKDFDISILADKSMTKDELLKDLEDFYTKEKQEKYGVIGIRVEDIRCPRCNHKLAQWIFGLPTPEAVQKMERKEAVSGGCCVCGDEPSWHCFKCHHDFDEDFADLGKEEPEEF